MFLDVSSSFEPFAMSIGADSSTVSTQKVVPTIELESWKLGSRHDRVKFINLFQVCYLNKLPVVLRRPLILTS